MDQFEAAEKSRQVQQPLLSAVLFLESEELSQAFIDEGHQLFFNCGHKETILTEEQQQVLQTLSSLLGLIHPQNSPLVLSHELPQVIELAGTLAHETSEDPEGGSQIFLGV